MKNYTLPLVIIAIFSYGLFFVYGEIQNDLKNEYDDAYRKTIDEETIDEIYKQTKRDVARMQSTNIPDVLKSIDTVWLVPKQALSHVVSLGWEHGLNVGNNKLVKTEGIAKPYVEVIGSIAQTLQWQSQVEQEGSVAVVNKTKVVPDPNNPGKVKKTLLIELVNIENEAKK